MCSSKPIKIFSAICAIFFVVLCLSPHDINQDIRIQLSLPLYSHLTFLNLTQIFVEKKTVQTLNISIHIKFALKGCRGNVTYMVFHIHKAHFERYELKPTFIQCS